MPKRFELSEKGIMEALEFLGAELPRKKVSEKDIIKTRLLAEECLFKLAKDAAEGTTFEIWIRSVLGNVTTKIKCKGKEIDFSDALALSGNDFKNAFDEEMDDSAIETIQNMLLKGFADKFKISRKKKYELHRYYHEERSSDDTIHHIIRNCSGCYNRIIHASLPQRDHLQWILQ